MQVLLPDFDIYVMVFHRKMPLVLSQDHKAITCGRLIAVVKSTLSQAHG